LKCLPLLVIKSWWLRMQRFVVKMANPTINDAQIHSAHPDWELRHQVDTLVDLILRRLENTNHVGCGGCGPKRLRCFSSRL
jgi:predicted alpha-1,6-mannanase (GH76 family)